MILEYITVDVFSFVSSLFPVKTLYTNQPKKVVSF